MAHVTPFRGIVYNRSKAGSLADVIAPPYDVISEADQEAYYAQSPYNVIRLILGKIHPSDTPEDNRYTRAAGHLEAWLSQEVLVRDPEPAFYLMTTEFKIGAQKHVRHGLIGLARLEPFEKGIILPHEKTFSKVKTDRLELMKACGANFSPIFTLFSDRENFVLSALKNAVVNKGADMDLYDDKHHRHRLWKITDPAVQKHVSGVMASKTLFIADGHHRYETALNYRDWLKETQPDLAPDHPANFIMMYFSCMEDPGMIILPAHRLLKRIAPDALEGLIPRAEACFEIRRFPFEAENRRQVQETFLHHLSLSASQNAIGVSRAEENAFYLLTARKEAVHALLAGEVPDALLALDVTVLTQAILGEILGFAPESLNDETLISYQSDAEKALAEVAGGGHKAAFILNPTKIEQVRAIAEQKLIMPRKSTYFYPKVVSGMVMNRLA